MKRSKVLVMLLMLTLVTTSVIGCKKVKEENSASNKSQKEVKQEEVKKEEKKEEEKKEEKKEKKKEEVKQEVKKEEVKQEVKREEVKQKVGYKALYKEEVDKLIAQYGRYENPTGGGSISGVKYGQLIDFDNDKVPEMIILHDKQVLLYTIQNDKLKCVYKGTVGSRYGQSDVSYNFGIYDKGNETYIVINNSENSWTEEVISAVTMKNKEVVIKKLNAKTAPDNDIPVRDNLISFYIDNKKVSKEEYYKVYNGIVKKCRNIDVELDDAPETAKAELRKFIQSLQ